MTDIVFPHGTRGVEERNDGLTRQIRLDTGGSQVFTQSHGKLHEAAVRGKLFVATIASVAPGTALSTAPALQLYNPTGSGKLLSIKKVSLGYVSGTLGAGSMVHSFYASQTAAPTSGTALTVRPLRLGSASTSVATAHSGSTIAGTSVMLRPSMIVGASLASTAYSPDIINDEVDGSIVVQPGVVWCFQGVAAAGSSPLVMLSVTFEELSDLTLTDY